MSFFQSLVNLKQKFKCSYVKTEKKVQPLKIITESASCRQQLSKKPARSDSKKIAKTKVYIIKQLLGLSVTYRDIIQKKLGVESNKVNVNGSE